MTLKCWNCQAANEIIAAGRVVDPAYRCWKCLHLNNGSALTNDAVPMGKEIQGTTNGR